MQQTDMVSQCWIHKSNAIPLKTLTIIIKYNFFLKSFYCTATTENTMTTSITIFCFHSVFIIHWQQCCNCTVSLTETQLKQNKISHPICSVKCVKCVLDHASVALHSDLFSVSDEWERVVWTGRVTLQTPQNTQVQTLQQNTIPHARTHWVLTRYTTMKNENELCWWV